MTDYRQSLKEVEEHISEYMMYAASIQDIDSDLPFEARKNLAYLVYQFCYIKAGETPVDIINADITPNTNLPEYLISLSRHKGMYMAIFDYINQLFDDPDFINRCNSETTADYALGIINIMTAVLIPKIKSISLRNSDTQTGDSKFGKSFKVEDIYTAGPIQSIGDHQINIVKEEHQSQNPFPDKAEIDEIAPSAIAIDKHVIILTAAVIALITILGIYLSYKIKNDDNFNQAPPTEISTPAEATPAPPYEPRVTEQPLSAPEKDYPAAAPAEAPAPDQDAVENAPEHDTENATTEEDKSQVVQPTEVIKFSDGNQVEIPRTPNSGFEVLGGRSHSMPDSYIKNEKNIDLIDRNLSKYPSK